VTPGGPQVFWGGGSPAAAKRAGRFGLGFFAQGGGAHLEQIYAEEARAHGHEPGACMIPPTDLATTVFVADDLDKAWDELGPHLLHDVTTYAALNPGNTHTASLSTATTIEALRAEDRTHRIVTVDQAVSLIESGVPLPLQPLVGGLPPDIAWPYLHTVTDQVMPRL
jgi:alkanesulfonate monooxygenase SsuD/methylene tetrahydromethanopterin reductase-like flavin-dependent oxidoreductase (luciferase family)